MIVYFIGGFLPHPVYCLELFDSALYCIFWIIPLLKDEERVAAVKIRDYELDPSLSFEIFPRLKKYIVNDRAIVRLSVQFSAEENPSNERIFLYLQAVQYRMAKSNYDNWEPVIVDNQVSDNEDEVEDGRWY